MWGHFWFDFNKFDMTKRRNVTGLYACIVF